MIGNCGCRSSSRCSRPRPGEVVADRHRSGVHEDRHVGVLEQPPRFVEQRVVEVELRHLQVQLEQLDAGVDQLSDVRRDALLGEERARPDHLGHVGRERARPVVEVRRDARLVRVGQRREPAYAHRPQQLDPLLVRLAVADRPGLTDLRPGGVEDVPHRLLDVGRQEVHVHVEEAGQPEPLPEGADRLDVLEPVRGVSHPCPSAGDPRPARSPGSPAARPARAACPRSSCPGPARSRPWPGR